MTKARDQRDAELAAVLADAVRAGKLQPSDALRVIKHEMRRRNTNKHASLSYWSSGAQAVVEKYSARGDEVPKNGSEEALHADHVYELGVDQLQTLITVDEWLEALARARTVAVVTAHENYKLEKLESGGLLGPAKYAAAGITWAGAPPPFLTEPKPTRQGSDGGS